MTEIDVWGAFGGGAALGERYGRQSRNARAYRQGAANATGDAAIQGGIGAMAAESGRVGDAASLYEAQGMQQRNRRFENEELQHRYDRMEQIAPWARKIVTAATRMPPEQARAFLSRPEVRQRFADWGFEESQIDAGVEALSSPDQHAREAFAAELESAFSQHQSPEFGVTNERTGEIGAINQEDGSYVRGAGNAPPAEPQWRIDGTTPYRVTPGGVVERGQGTIPHVQRTGGAGGRAPSGYRFTEGGDLEPIPGGPRAGTQVDPQEAISELGRMQDNITEARNAGWGEHGALGAVYGVLPGTRSYNLRNSVLPSLRANLAFDALIRLKAAGGTLGAISDAELQLLQSKIAALDPNAGEKEFERQLAVVEQQIESSIRRIQAAAQGAGAMDARPAPVDPPRTRTGGGAMTPAQRAARIAQLERDIAAARRTAPSQ